MEQNIDVILDFLHHIKALATKALKNTDDITKAIDIIKKLRSGDVRLLPGIMVQLILSWLPSARRLFAHKNDVVNDLRQSIVYMEIELARLTSGQEAATTIKKAEEMTFQAKIEQLTDENQKLKQKTEDMAKVHEELKQQNEELRKRLETMESRSVGEVCRPKVISSRRSPGQTEHMTPDFSIPVDFGSDLDNDLPSVDFGSDLDNDITSDDFGSDLDNDPPSDDFGSDLDNDPPSAKTRLEEEELKRKISNLKEERRFVEIENTSPIHVMIGVVVGGFFGGLLGGPPGVIVGAAYALGASAGGFTI